MKTRRSRSSPTTNHQPPSTRSASHPPRRRQRGFTLLELGIVLGVMAILAAIVVPDLIETARNKMAQKAAEDVGRVQEAAQWAFYESGTSNDAYSASWPGETSPNTCQMGTGNATADKRLVAEGYLTAANLRNPWGHAYDLSLSPGTSGAVCSLVVATNVPTSVSELYAGLLPSGTCGAACPGGPAPSSFSRCCSRVPKPGGEAAVQAAFSKLKLKWVPEKALARVDPGKIQLQGPCKSGGCPTGAATCRKCELSYELPLKTAGQTFTRASKDCQCGFTAASCSGQPTLFSCN